MESPSIESYKRNLLWSSISVVYLLALFVGTTIPVGLILAVLLLLLVGLSALIGLMPAAYSIITNVNFDTTWVFPVITAALGLVGFGLRKGYEWKWG